MDAENSDNPRKKDLTNADQADRIWLKVKEKVATMKGRVIWNCQIIGFEGQIVEIRYRQSEVEECIRA